MLWLAAASFFCWCAFREVLWSFVPRPGFPAPRPISKPYLALVTLLALGFAWPPVRQWQFQAMLSARATELAEGHRAHVHCNTVFDTMLDTEMLAAGHANPATGDIVFQAPWCGTLRAYLAHPGRASGREIASLGIFTHEAMHVRGELNEAITECEAVQRNYRAARMLGVPDEIAKRNALAYYDTTYRERARIGGMQSAYYSDECAPGRALDEHLSDSIWRTGEQPQDVGFAR